MLTQLAPTRARIAGENLQFSNIFDTTAARTDLAFHPTVSWPAGVQRMVSWLDEHQRIENSDDEPFEDHLIATWRQQSAEMVRKLAASGGAV